MSNPLLHKNFLAGGAIAAFRIVRFSAADTVVQASAVGDGLIGVNDDAPALSGERCDVVMSGMCFVEAGAAFSAGARLTTDAQGRAVAAAPAAGVNNAIIGMAVDAAVAAGDIVRMMISQHSLQG
jgi:hypothetical protein